MKKAIAIAVFIFSSAYAHAGVRQYAASLEQSNWQFAKKSRLQCELKHNIPNYGQARFYSKASRELNMEFELDMLRLPDTYNLAELRSVPPSWRPGLSERVITDMKLHKQFSPNLSKKVAWTMLSELEQGMNPTFYYNDWYNDNDKIAVALSTAKFKHAYQRFVTCLGNLLDYSFEDIADTVLQYQFGSDKLTKDSKRKVAQITEYLSLDPELELVLINAYTDSYGGRETNRKISEKRAEQIKNYLVKSGVDATRIKAKGYGEKRHVASNRTELERAQNRRVVVHLGKP
jgi:outer membrane protein OmpA-like peptidoglycan-associated protein